MDSAGIIPRPASPLLFAGVWREGQKTLISDEQTEVLLYGGALVITSQVQKTPASRAIVKMS